MATTTPAADGRGVILSNGRYMAQNGLAFGKEPLSDSHPWIGWLKLIDSYVEANGTADVRQLYITPEGEKLGQWVGNRRVDYRKEKLSEEWVKLFESLPGWTWSHNLPTWEQYFTFIKIYADKHGNCDIPEQLSPPGLSVRGWMSRQRVRRRSGTLPEKRISQLETLPGWKWEPVHERWLDKLSALRQFLVSNPGLSYRQAPSSISNWAKSQIRAFHTEKLTVEQKALLNDLPQWSWSMPLDSWHEMFRLLKIYGAREHHLYVERDHIEQGEKLGWWVSVQRYLYRRGELEPDRIQKLESLTSWDWDPDRLVRRLRKQAKLRLPVTSTEFYRALTKQDLQVLASLDLDAEIHNELLTARSHGERILLLAQWKMKTAQEGVSAEELSAVYAKLNIKEPNYWPNALSNARNAVRPAGQLGRYQPRNDGEALLLETGSEPFEVRVERESALTVEQVADRLRAAGTTSSVKATAVAVVNAQIAGVKTDREAIAQLIEQLFPLAGIETEPNVGFVLSNSARKYRTFLHYRPDGVYMPTHLAVALASEVLGPELVFGVDWSKPTLAPVTKLSDDVLQSQEATASRPDVSSL